MTGLDIKADEIIEFACILTDGLLNVIAEVSVIITAFVIVVAHYRGLIGLFTSRRKRWIRWMRGVLNNIPKQAG